MKHRLLGLFALVLALILTPALRAQTSSAAITGVVTDSSGAVVPGVHITLTDTATGNKYEGVTDQAGSYLIHGVNPGPAYTEKFTRDGFKTVLVTGIYLNVARTRTQNAQLQAGAVVTTVSVSAASENVTLNTTDATIGNSFEVQMVNELPVQVRDTPAALFTMQPGISTDSSGEAAVTGARTDQSHVTLDGLDVDDRGTGQFGVVTANAPVDSVQEFRGVVAGENSSSDSGGGGQYELVTKSGTNKFHGALFEYHRDTDLEANNWFNNNASPAVPRSPLIRNQFGGNLGGPVRKDKFFFFFEYNGRRDDLADSVEQTVPTASFLAGNISYINDGAGCTKYSTLLSAPQCISTVNAATVAANYDPTNVGQDAALAAFIAKRYPAGNDPTYGDGINTTGFRFNAPVNLKENDYVSRLDYTLTPTNKLWARVSVQSQREGDYINYLAPIQFPGDPTTRAIDEASWAWVVGDDWAIGANKSNRISYGETISRLDFPSLYNPTGALSWGFGPLANPYLGNYNAQGRVIPVPQLRDDFSWNKGRHSFGFGGTFKFITPYSDVVLNDYTPSLGLGNGVGLTQLSPTYRPNDILNSTTAQNYWDNALVFDLGAFSELGATFNYNANGSVQPMGQGTSRKYRYYETEVYFGDTWKVLPSLTLDYGLRYQLYTVPYEVHGLEAIQVNASTGKPFSFDDYFFKNRVPQSNAGVSGATAVPFLEYELGGKANNAPGYYNPSYKDFAPRFGFAWQPPFDQKSVFNGSVGIVYDHTVVSAVQNFQDHSSYLFQNSNNNIYGTSADVTGSLTSDPRFTGINSIPTPPNAPAFSSKEIPYVDFTTNPPTPYGLGDNTFSTAIDPNLKTPYSIIIDAGFQRQLGGGFILSMSYAGRMGRRLLAQVDASQVLNFLDPTSGERYATAFGNIVKEIRAGEDPNTLPAEPWFENQVGTGFTDILANYFANLFYNGDIADFSQALAANQLISPNVVMASQFSSNDYYTNKGFSSYNGLLTTLHKNAGHGLQFDLNYTWSHSIDNFSLIANGQSNYVGEFICDATRPRECRGSSDFDQTQVLNGDFIYQLPFGRGRAWASDTPRVVNEFIGGWELSGLPSWHTGDPYYVNTTAYGAGYATLAPAILVGSKAELAPHVHKDAATGAVFAFNDPNTAANQFTGPVGLTLGQRNELRDPGYFNIDLGLGKTFPITERTHFVFRADAFNALNHPSFNGPNTNLESGQFGYITSTASTARVLQGALRLEF